MEAEIQEKRYQHFENKRNGKIQKAIQRRNDIITNPDKVFSKVIYILLCFLLLFLILYFSFSNLFLFK